MIPGARALDSEYCGGQWGRLEVNQGGSWGQICDENFGDADARVSCVQMGYGDGYQLHVYHYAGRTNPAAGSLPVLMIGPGCSGTESRLQDCPNFGTAPSSSSQCETPRYAAGVLCLASKPTEEELLAICPKFIYNANNQPNKATHPLRIATYFPGGSHTSGFGGTGVSTNDGGLGNYAGTYRTQAEIQAAWNEIEGTTVPSMGGHEYRYPFCTKNFAYSSLAADISQGPCEAWGLEASPQAVTSSTTSGGSNSDSSGTVRASSISSSNDGTTSGCFYVGLVIPTILGVSQWRLYALW